jgi:hypothetical protein
MQSIATEFQLMPCYWLLLVGFVIQNRLVLAAAYAFLQVNEDDHRRSFRQHWWLNILGVRPRWDQQQFPSDYWYNTIIGAIELLLYPIFMALNGWAAIGAWLTLKTIARWNFWSTTEGRSTFNLYLVGNAFVLLESLLMWHDCVLRRQLTSPSLFIGTLTP